MYAGDLTYRLPLHECISHIYLYCWFVFTPLLMIDKKGENDFEFIYAYLFWVYICIFKNWVYAYILSLCMSYILCLYKKGEKDFEGLYKKGKKVFGEKNSWFMHVSLTLFRHIYLFSFMYFIEYLFVYC